MGSQYGIAGPIGVVSMASAVSITSGFDLGKPWTRLAVQIPSMASGSDVYVLGSTDGGTTYKRVFHAPTLASATPTAVFVTSGVTNCIVQLPPLAIRHIQFQLSTATTDTPYTFKIFAAD